MSEAVTTEAGRLALKLISTSEHADNERSFLAALKAVDDPIDRLSIAFTTSRILAGQIREFARTSGTLDHLLDEVDRTLLDDREDQ